MKTPKAPEVKMPYTAKAASFASDAGPAETRRPAPGAATSAAFGAQQSRTGRPSLLGGVS